MQRRKFLQSFVGAVAAGPSVAKNVAAKLATSTISLGPSLTAVAAKAVKDADEIIGRKAQGIGIPVKQVYKHHLLQTWDRYKDRLKGKRDRDDVGTHIMGLYKVRQRKAAASIDTLRSVSPCNRIAMFERDIIRLAEMAEKEVAQTELDLFLKEYAPELKKALHKYRESHRESRKYVGEGSEGPYPDGAGVMDPRSPF